jgi:hypothetical protein
VSWIKERLKTGYNHDTGGGQEPSIKTGSMRKLEGVEEILLAVGIHQEEIRARRRPSLGFTLTLERIAAM